MVSGLEPEPEGAIPVTPVRRLHPWVLAAVCCAGAAVAGGCAVITVTSRDPAVILLAGLGHAAGALVALVAFLSIEEP